MALPRASRCRNIGPASMVHCTIEYVTRPQNNDNIRSFKLLFSFGHLFGYQTALHQAHCHIPRDTHFRYENTPKCLSDIGEFLMIRCSLHRRGPIHRPEERFGRKLPSPIQSDQVSLVTIQHRPQTRDRRARMAAGPSRRWTPVL